MNAEEYGMRVWRAGEIVPAGPYLRVDDHSFRMAILEQEGYLPASYDGHIALYCRAPALCPLNAQAGKSVTVTQDRGNSTGSSPLSSGLEVSASVPGIAGH